MAEKYQPTKFNEGDWWCEARMGIKEVRIVHHTLEEYMKNTKDIPEDHLSYLEHMHSKLFGMIAEFNFVFQKPHDK